MSLVLLLAAALQAPREAAPPRTIGLVVLAGEGAAIDAATCAELGADLRVMLVAGDPGKVVDPLAAAGAPAWRTDLDPARPFPGDDRETAERVRGARCVVLAGGSYLDWFALVTPGGGTSRLSDSIRAAHKGGASIVAAGAAAPFLAEWAMVERSALEKPQRNPRRVRDDVAVEGLGLLPELLVDSSACEPEGPARLVRAALDFHLERALYIEGAAVWIADPRGKTARVRGAGSALLFDLSVARRLRGACRGGRLAMLAGGDRWSEREGVECREAVAPERQAALGSSLENAGTRISFRERERTDARGACEIAFDLEWQPGGS